MGRLIARRAAQGAVIVWLVASLTFLLLHLAPGDPVQTMLASPRIAPSVRAQWAHALCLDRPLAGQYACYLGAVARGDFGWSVEHQRAVRDVLLDALPNTLLLMTLGLLLSFVVGIALGALQARRRGTIVDWGVSAGSLFFYSMPDFWLALMMMALFAYGLGLFPVAGTHDPVMYPYLGPGQRLLDRAWHLVLPVATLTLLSAAGVARFQRAAMLDVSHQDFVRTARAKGLDERAVARRHVLRNALLPVITLLGISLPYLLAGTVFVEQVFAWPGIGFLTVSAIGSRDYALVLASVLLTSVVVVLGTLLADVLYAAVDPRVRVH